MSVVERPAADPASTSSRGGHSGPARALVAERCAAVVSLLVAAGIGLRAESFVTQSSFARPGTMPPHALIWVGAAVLGVASAFWVVQAFRRTEPLEVPDVGPAKDAALAFVVLAVGAWSATWLGLLIASALTYVALLVFYRDRGWLFISISTISYLLVLHYGLEVLLAVPLPRSPLIPLPF